jgi:hypothetical protein
MTSDSIVNIAGADDASRNCESSCHLGFELEVEKYKEEIQYSWQ